MYTLHYTLFVSVEPTSEFGPGDMVALGVTQGALLCISAGASGFLFFRIRSLGAGWSNVTGINMGQSSVS